MRNIFSFKKTVAALSAAALLVAVGIPGISSITAWALPSSGTVAQEDTRVRASAVDGEVLDTLPEDKSVSIVDSTTGSDGEVWYEVRYSVGDEELSGWIRSDLLNVEGEDAEEAAEEQMEETIEEAAEAVESEEEKVNLEEGVDPVATSAGGVTYVIATTSIPSDVIPDGFQLTTASYEGKEVPALVMNNASVYLLYMEDASGTAPGRLVVYDMAKSELIPYISFETKDGFILLLNIPDAELETVSDRFELTTCEFVDSGSIDALRMTQSDAIISESANLADYYYMYGVNRDGMYGWYVYNSAEGMIESNILNMHYNLNGTTVDEEEAGSGFSLDSLSLVVIVGIIVVLLLLVILVIIFGVRYRQLAKEMDAMEAANAAKGRTKSGGSNKKSGSGPGQAPPTRSTLSGDTQSYDHFSSPGGTNAGSATSGSTNAGSATPSGGMSQGADIPKTEPLTDTQPTPKPPTKTQPVRKTDPDDDDLEFL